ncbi:hypothetical protein RRG08_010062 [Elysia crispata]|uniref:Uncharacterized protein n=1 Tax=Elysia crispata TaxID=231223 RepID=A0AAE1EC28_9GAST|nr:hypothetical protein RRG08_010062 [Elysia crispata]
MLMASSSLPVSEVWRPSNHEDTPPMSVVTVWLGCVIYNHPMHGSELVHHFLRECQMFYKQKSVLKNFY